jgi:uncharacterized membrane protein
MKKTLLLLFLVLVPVIVFGGTQNENNLVLMLKGVHNFVIVIGLIVCLIGFSYGAIKMGAGDENGKRIIIGAIIAAVILISSKIIFNVVNDQGKKAQIQNSDVDSAFQ